MTERTLTIAEIILIAGTRVVLDTGIGLLLAGRLNKDQRKAAGAGLGWRAYYDSARARCHRKEKPH
jgi:hypothetical protein